MEIEEVKIKVLVDDVAGTQPKGLLGQHGLAIMIEAHYDSGRVFKVLFDTGQEFKTLLHNADLLNEEISSIDAIAISHRHYD
ncbi:MAG TPA: MBL fold metallo-hydrolase, partial [Thermoprotei archaeon]|nr:MBL fold metallo-hydrolase [Thermoprotei archaeon]